MVENMHSRVRQAQVRVQTQSLTNQVSRGKMLTLSKSRDLVYKGGMMTAVPTWQAMKNKEIMENVQQGATYTVRTQ